MSGMSDLVEWAAIEAAAWTRVQADHDEHVHCKDRFHVAVTVRLCVLFSEQARERCDDAMRELDRAIDRVQAARAHLNRTTDMLAMACRLSAMGRR